MTFVSSSYQNHAFTVLIIFDLVEERDLVSDIEVGARRDDLDDCLGGAAPRELMLINE